MKFRKQHLLPIIILVTMLFVTVGASAQGEPVNVSPIPSNDGAVYNITNDQEVHIFWAWLALNPGLVQEYLDASHDSYVLQGPGGTVAISETEAEPYWSPVIQAPPGLAGWDCPRPLVAGSIFDYNLGELSPGTYTLTSVVTLDHPVNDALQICTLNGQPLASPPSLYDPGTNVSSVTINVTSAD